MNRKIWRSLRVSVFALFYSVLAGTSAFASVDNPLMGDNSGQYLGIVMVTMGVALVIIIVILAVFSRKKK